MKPPTLLTISFLLAVSSRAQPQPKARAKAVSLETVLSCQKDELIQSVFDLTEDDMFKLSLLKVGSIPPEATNEKVRAVSHNFYVSPGDEKTWRVLPEEKPPSFCHDYLIVGGFASPTGKSYDHESHAAFAKILAYKNWILDPNEVFKHADQFTFKSGTFGKSTSVYLEGTKGGVNIQFIFESGTLKLYRVFYTSPRFMPK